MANPGDGGDRFIAPESVEQRGEDASSSWS
jgi:hypothetical protein